MLQLVCEIRYFANYTENILTHASCVNTPSVCLLTTTKNVYAGTCFVYRSLMC